jgi:IclR family mhp operon transcriptional activator
MRESTGPIRALHRGLAVLTELNKLERAAIHTLAAAVDLPRTTTYRILETLRTAGFVQRDAHDWYRPTVRVRALSDGFDSQALVTHLARPLLDDLDARLLWPLALATPCGAAMMIRVCTDGKSPRAVEHYSAGMRVPMLASAAGRAFLACCAAAQRDSLLEVLSYSLLPEDRLARNRVELERLLHDTRSQGYGMVHRARRDSDETSLAVPVRAKERMLATVAVRFDSGAVPLRQAVEEFIPRMRDLARTIEAQLP